MGSLFSKLRKKKQAKNAAAANQSIALSPVAATPQSNNQTNNQTTNQPVAQIPANIQTVNQTAPPLNRDDPGQQTTYYPPTPHSVNQSSINITIDQPNLPSPAAINEHQSNNQSIDQTNKPEPVIEEDDDLTTASNDVSLHENQPLNDNQSNQSNQSINQVINQPIEVSTGEKSLSFWGLQKTVRPLKAVNTRLGVTIQATMRATLGGGDLRQNVQLPPGENLAEWIAVNTVHFFNEACMIYGTCNQFCTPSSCPRMVAGKAEYLWQDNDQYKKPTAMSAPEYIDKMLAWVDDQLNDQELFPTEEGVKFPRNFMSQNKQIYKRLFRLYAHLYCAHAIQIKSIGANAHLNTLFKHFIYFVQEFQLIDKADLLPLDRLIEKIKAQDR